MIKPMRKNFKGLITITGPTNSGKSELAEFLIKEQDCVTYIATSKIRSNDPEWQKRIEAHRQRRPDSWNLIEHPIDICNTILSIQGNESILIDSIGGFVEHHLLDDEDNWEKQQNNLINALTNNELGIVIVAEEVGWGIVPATAIGHLFRERHSRLTSLISHYSSKNWLTINGTAIELDKIGEPIP